MATAVWKPSCFSAFWTSISWSFCSISHALPECWVIVWSHVVLEAVGGSIKMSNCPVCVSSTPFSYIIWPFANLSCLLYWVQPPSSMSSGSKHMTMMVLLHSGTNKSSAVFSSKCQQPGTWLRQVLFNKKNASLLFADYVVLLASSSQDLNVRWASFQPNVKQPKLKNQHLSIRAHAPRLEKGSLLWLVVKKELNSIYWSIFIPSLT